MDDSKSFRIQLSATGEKDKDGTYEGQVAIDITSERAVGLLLRVLEDILEIDYIKYKPEIKYGDNSSKIIFKTEDRAKIMTLKAGIAWMGSRHSMLVGREN